MSNQIKSAVISGPTGSIGMALIEKLMYENFNILLLVHKNSIKKRNLLNFVNVKIIEVDLNEYSQLNIDDKYDIFFHFAWLGTSGESRNDYNSQILNIKHSIDAVNLANKIRTKKIREDFRK